MQRSSRKRDAVYEAVKMSRAHPTAQDVWLQLRPVYPDLSLATVYRNLGEFAQEGRVRRLDSADGQCRFDGDISPHAHFTCERCGAFLDVPFDLTLDLTEQVEHSLGVRVLGHDLSFSGLCADCKEA